MKTILVIFLIMFIIALFRRLHQKYVGLKYTYRVYALRDELRMMGITGKIDSNKWIFDYFDKSFSTIINEHYYITLFRLLVLDIKYKNDKELSKFKVKFENECKNYPDLENILTRFREVTKEYIENQHYVTGYFIIMPILTLFKGARFIADQINKLVESVFILPETSESKTMILIPEKSNPRRAAFIK